MSDPPQIPPYLDSQIDLFLNQLQEIQDAHTIYQKIIASSTQQLNDLKEHIFLYIQRHFTTSISLPITVLDSNPHQPYTLLVKHPIFSFPNNPNNTAEVLIADIHSPGFRTWEGATLQLSLYSIPSSEICLVTESGKRLFCTFQNFFTYFPRKLPDSSSNYSIPNFIEQDLQQHLSPTEIKINHLKKHK
jgi:hypothetical protein